ncbi:hypothetical protein BDV93DRAFT_526431 [Ceratobasidium sp. AG-I]|nr:hypothetical protein BDV93DRAFT_526431 [Ceratobasidium sp. AG-I]
MCDRAAHKIVQLINMFNEQHGISCFPRSMLKAIFTTGLALLQESASAPPAAARKRASAQECVVACINALRTLGQTWPYSHELSNELQSRLQNESELPSASSLQSDPPPFIDVDGLDQVSSADLSIGQDWDDQLTTEISQAFYQFVQEWERTHSSYPDGVQPALGAELFSESSASFSGEFLPEQM